MKCNEISTFVSSKQCPLDLYISDRSKFTENERCNKYDSNDLIDLPINNHNHFGWPKFKKNLQNEPAACFDSQHSVKKG